MNNEVENVRKGTIVAYIELMIKRVSGGLQKIVLKISRCSIPDLNPVTLEYDAGLSPPDRGVWFSGNVRCTERAQDKFERLFCVGEHGGIAMCPE
jgi:hypothetical protein